MGTVTPSPWKQLLLSAIESNSHLKHSYFVQFATIGSNGRPSNRSVVFRGFEENSNRIQINTDFRTRKIEELNHCPFAELCWYFTDSWEQFRINGRVDVIDGSNPNPAKLQQREKLWFASSIKSRLQYLGPNPGLPCLSEQSPAQFFVDPSSGPVATFCLLVLEPDQGNRDRAMGKPCLAFSLRRRDNVQVPSKSLKGKRGRLYIIMRCVLMLVCWRDHGDK